MKPFKYSPATTVILATQKINANPQAKYLAGGTNLLDLMKEGIEQPNELVDITRLKLVGIKTITIWENKGCVSIGAIDKITETAIHPLIQQNFPMLSQAILLLLAHF